MSDDILLRRIDDIFALCEKYHTLRFSQFLDAAEQAVIKNQYPDCTLFGGYDGAERCMLGAFPDWQEPDFGIFPIKVLEFIKKYDKSLTHRHYLGTILSMGIDRGKIGDILVDSERAYVFLSEDIAEFVKNGINKIAGVGVETQLRECGDIVVPEKRFEEIDTVCASMRLDAVLAAVLNISRSRAKTFIMSGRAAVNHVDTLNADCILKEGDLLSIRGFGRVEIEDIGRKTRSDRLHITLKKYI